MSILVTIAARGGSKGVKNKNIRPLLGLPLIAHTIRHAQEWGRADKIVVSTDSNQIADVARQFNVDVPFMRPENLATDTSGKLDVIRHALIMAEEIYGQKFDAVVDLDATSPLRQNGDIEGCWKKFCDTNSDVLFSVVQSHKNPYFNMVELNAEGRPELVKKLGSHVLRRQDAPQVYSLNASIYCYRRKFLMQESPKLFDSNCTLYEMDSESAFDIDSETDFKIVEQLMKLRGE